MAEQQVIKVDRNDLDDQAPHPGFGEGYWVLCCRVEATHPSSAPRPNEVGNDVEEYVMRSLAEDAPVAEPTDVEEGVG